MTSVHVRPSDINLDNWRLLRATAKEAHKSLSSGVEPSQEGKHAMCVLASCKLDQPKSKR